VKQIMEQERANMKAIRGDQSTYAGAAPAKEFMHCMNHEEGLDAVLTRINSRKWRNA